jgi:exonuclease III
VSFSTRYAFTTTGNRIEKQSRSSYAKSTQPTPKTACQANLREENGQLKQDETADAGISTNGVEMVQGGRDGKIQTKQGKEQRVDMLNVSTFNVRTLNDKLMNGRPLARLIGLLVENNVDICGVQEVKREGKHHLREMGYEFYHSDGGNKSHHGVGIAIRSSIAQTNDIYIRHSSPRALYLVLKVKGKESLVHLITAHAPTEVAKEEDKDAFYKELDQILEDVNTKERVFIMIDANARTGVQSDTNAKVVGNFGRDELNKNGERLINFCHKYKLCLANTFFQKKAKQHTYTKRGRNNSIYRWRLDYIVIRQEQRRNIMDAEVVQNSETFGSDHKMVRATFKYKMKGTPSKGRRHRNSKTIRDYSLLKYRAGEETEIQDKFVEKINVELATMITEEKQKPSLTERIERLEEVIKDSSETYLRRELEDQQKELTYKGSEDTNSSNLKKYKDRMYKLYANEKSKDKNSEEYREYRKTQKKLKILHKRTKLNVMEKRCKHLEEAFSNQSSTYFYQVAKLNIYEEKVEDRSISLSSEDKETTIYDDEGIRKRLAEYTKSLLNEDFEPKQSLLDSLENEAREPDERLADIPDTTEIKEAIKSLKNNKAPGEDMIPAECYKILQNEGFEELTKCIQEVWNTGEVPQKWKDTIFVYLYKNKGSRQECSNYRGIALTAHIGKIVLTIIKSRLEKYAEKHQLFPEEQFGFRKQRSTEDGMFILRRLSEEVVKNSEKMYATFVDLKKAYDTVDRQLMWAVLAKRGIPRTVLRLLRNFYDGMQSRVRHAGKLSQPFETRRGLRQGCVLSPMLFIFYIAEVMERTKNLIPQNAGIEIETENEKSKLWNLFFADDAVFIDRKIENMQRQIDSFNKICDEFGLTISVKKTKVMVFKADTKAGTEEQESQNSKIEIKVNGETLEQVDKFKYLGGIMSSDTKCEAEIAKRVNMAKFAFFNKYKEFFRSWVPLRIKMRIYNTCILTILLYGCVTWTLTKPLLCKLETTHMNMLRFILDKKRRVHIRNKMVLTKLETCRIQEKVAYLRIKYAGRVSKMKEARLPWKLMNGKIPKEHTNSRRRNTKSWTLNLTEDMESYGMEQKKGEPLGKGCLAKLETGREYFRRQWIKKDDAKYLARKEKEKEKEQSQLTNQPNTHSSP